MFDKGASDAPGIARRLRRVPVGPDDERIALRCSRKELQLVDSFVVTGEFRSRSELMREALRSFLRSRSLMGPAVTPHGAGTAPVEVAVRLRPEEVEAFAAYGHLVANGQDLPDTLAQLVRRGDLELKVSELVQHARATVRRAAQTREQLDQLKDTGRELERKGVVGR